MNKKYIRYIILGLFLLLFPCRVWGQSAPVVVEVEMDVSYGFGNTIKSNSCVPICVELSCKNNTVAGTLQVEVPIQSEGNLNASIWMSDPDGMSNKNQCYIWERQVNLEAGETQTEILYIELPFYNGYFNVEFLSDDIETAVSEQIYCDYTENSSRLLVGVVSEDTIEISQLNGMQVKAEGYYNSDIFVKALSLKPEEIYDNPLALQQLDLLIVDKGTEFTKEQKAAIELWHESGGLYYEREEEHLNEVYLLLTSGENEERFLGLLDKMNYYYFYSNNFDYIPLKEKIPLGRYILIIAIYVAAVGPGLYWMLRNKKDPRWLVGSVSVLSLVCFLCVYLSGRNINMSTPTICYDILYEQQGEYLNETVDFSVQAYQMQDYELNLDGGYHVRPQNMGSAGIGEVDTQTSEIVTFSDDGEKSTLLLQNMSAYRQNCFSMEKNENLKIEEQISMKITGNGEYVQIEWENPTEYSIKQAVLVLRNRIAILGELKPYSKGTLAEGRLYAYSDDGISVLLRDLLDFSEYEFPEFILENFSNKIWLELNQMDEEQPFVMGILENPKNVFSENAGFDVYGMALMKLCVDIDWMEDEILWCVNLETYGETYKGEYTADYNLLESKEAIVDYCTDFIGTLEFLEFFRADYSRREYYIPFEGKIYLFNWQTGTFTEMIYDEPFINSVLIAPYISDTGILRVYYVMDEWMMNSNRSCVLPSIKASGRVE